MHYVLFADDSQDADFYTVAGYIAQVDEWGRFSPAWHATLKERPRLGYYRTTDSMALKGPFDGWSVEARDARVTKLASVVHSTNCYGLAAHLSRRDFQQLFAPNFLPIYNDPYYICAEYLVSETCRAFYGHATRIDFCFDRQGKVGTNFKIVYRALVKPASLPLFPFMGEVRHADKQQFLPLQAADMHASWVRRRQSVIQLPSATDCWLSRVRQTDFQITRGFLERLAKYKTEHESEVRAFSDSIERGDFAASDAVIDDLKSRSRELRKKFDSYR